MNRMPRPRRPGAQLHYVKRRRDDGSCRTVEDAFKHGETLSWWARAEYIGTASDFYIFQERE